MAIDASNSSQNASGCSRVGISIFFSFFLIMGLVFCVVIGIAFWENLETWFWQKTPCTILESRHSVDASSDEPYSAQIVYQYTFDDLTHTSDTITPEATSTDNYRRIQRLLLAFPSGSERFCYVNGEKPGVAYLKRGQLWMGLFIFLPLIFVAVGAGGIIGTWRRTPPKALTAATKPVTASASNGCGPRVGLFAGLFLTLIGVILFYFLGMGVVVNLSTASGWHEVPCRVLHSQLLTHRGDDSTTYSVDIFYRYQVGDITYHSNSYGFMGGSSSGTKGKRKILAAYPSGSEALCYVNPADPVEAVLDRGFHPLYLLSFLPLLLVLVGVLVLGKSFRTATAPTPPAFQRGDVQAMVLKPKQGPLPRVAGTFFIMAFWNGIVSVFLWQVIDGFRRGDPEWFLTIFLIPFVLIGIFLVGLFLRAVLCLFNPVPQVRLDPGKVSLGGTALLQWRVRGRVSRIARLTITLEGHEEAVYTVGTNTHTDTDVFYSQMLAEIADWREMLQGKCPLTIPHDTMHSFAAKHNKIIWSIKVKGDIPRWPDVDEAFEIEVTP